MQYNNGIRHIAYNLLNITNQFCVTMIGYQSLNTGMGSGTSSTIGDHLPAKYDFLMAYLRKLPSMVTLIWNYGPGGHHHRHQPEQCHAGAHVRLRDVHE